MSFGASSLNVVSSGSSSLYPNAWTLVIDEDFTGAASKSVTGLSGNYAYRILINIDVAVAATELHLCVNADTTDANYHAILTELGHGAVSSSRVNRPAIDTIDNGVQNFVEILCWKSNSDYFEWNSRGTRNFGASVSHCLTYGMKSSATIAEITDLTIKSNSGNNITGHWVILKQKLEV